MCLSTVLYIVIDFWISETGGCQHVHCLDTISWREYMQKCLKAMVILQVEMGTTLGTRMARWISVSCPSNSVKTPDMDTRDKEGIF